MDIDAILKLVALVFVMVPAAQAAEAFSHDRVTV